MSKKRHGTDVNGRAMFFTPDCCLWLNWLEDLLSDQGKAFTYFQGGFRPVSEVSSGTHGKDAVDAWVNGWSGDQTMRFVKRHGGFGWHRTQADGFDEHCHFGPIPGAHNGCELAPEMTAQLASYRALRNGLVNNARDRNPYRPDPQYIFNREDVMDLSDKQINQLAKATAAKIKVPATDEEKVAEAVLDHAINNSQPGSDKDFAGKSVRDVAKETKRNTDRIGDLEPKVAALESQISDLETHLDGQFDSVQQALVQIVQQLQSK